MIKRIKHHLSERWEWVLLFCILLFTIAVIALSEKPIKVSAEDYAALKGIKACMERTDIYRDASRCAALMGIDEEKVVEIAQKAVQYSHDNSLKGVAFFVLNDLENARTAFEAAFAENQSLELAKDLAFVSSLLYESKKVVYYCGKILADNPQDIDCLTLIAIAYYDMENNTLAVENMQKASSIEAHVCRNFNLGIMYGAVGELEKAQNMIDNAIEENKNILLHCWSPVMMIPSPEDVNRFNICFYSKNRMESVCRPFAQRDWKIVPTQM